MAKGGFDNPMFEHEDRNLDDQLDNDDDDDDDEQEVITTRPFQPGSASTPHHGGEQVETQTMHHEKSGMPDTSYAEISSFSDFVSAEDEKGIVDRFIKGLKSLRPKAKLEKMDPMGLGKKPQNKGKFVSFGPRGGETPVFDKVL